MEAEAEAEAEAIAEAAWAEEAHAQKQPKQEQKPQEQQQKRRAVQVWKAIDGINKRKFQFQGSGYANYVSHLGRAGEYNATPSCLLLSALTAPNPFGF